MSDVSMRQVRATYKVRDSWWTVLLVDPVAGRLTRWAARHRWLTPNRLTAAGFLLGLAAAAAFLTGAAGWLVAGVLLYHLGFVLDCVDGKLARLTGTGSVFGSWLDFFLDRVRVMVCAVALFTGQFLTTDRPAYLFAAIGFVFLALFGYVNGAETDKARARLAGGQTPPDDDALIAAAPAGGWMAKVRAGLHRRRIRMNLVSGIEFEMAVLVVAPVAVALAGAVALLWVTGVAAGLLLLCEAALLGRFWLATRAAAATRAAVATPPGTTDSAAGAPPRIPDPAAPAPDPPASASTPATPPQSAPTSPRRPPRQPA